MRIPGVGLVALSCLLIAGAAAANDCKIEQREMGGQKGLPQIRQTVCPVPGASPSETLNVTFLRLGEVLTGNLVMGEVVPEFERAYGGAPLVKNEIYQEVETLFRRFARKTDFPADQFPLAMKILKRDAKGNPLIGEIETNPPLDNAQAIAQLEKNPSPAAQDRRFWTISSPYKSEIELPGGLFHFSTGAMPATSKDLGWPAGFKHTYSSCGDDDPIRCLRQWRFIELKEIDGLEQAGFRALKRMEDQLRRQGFPRESAKRKDPVDWIEDYSAQKGFKIHFDFCRHIGRFGWSSQFLILEVSNEACAGTPETGYRMPSLAMEVAVLQNSSKQAVKINLLGVQDKEKKLRLNQALADGSPISGRLQQGELEIGPGKQIIVPLRIVFEGFSQKVREESQKEAEKAFNQIIRQQPAGHIFSSESDDMLSGRSIKIRKKRESFLAPETPDIPEHLYGPAISLTGLAIKTDELSIKSAEAFIALLAAVSEPQRDSNTEEIPLTLDYYTVGNPGASCPYFYSFNEATGNWLNHGKVIHTAKGIRNEETEIVKVGTNVRRIRLAEEEPEVAYIRKVEMHLNLHDGRRLTLDPRENRHTKSAGFYMIPAYTYIDFDFDLPAGYSDKDIASAEVAVTGYYLPYNVLAPAEVSSTGSDIQR